MDLRSVLCVFCTAIILLHVFTLDPRNIFSLIAPTPVATIVGIALLVPSVLVPSVLFVAPIVLLLGRLSAAKQLRTALRM